MVERTLPCVVCVGLHERTSTAQVSQLTVFTHNKCQPLMSACPQSSQTISPVSVLPGLKSDHSIINHNLNTNDDKRSWGFWKVYSQLLHDKDYVDK